MARSYFPGLWPADWGTYYATSQPAYDGGGDISALLNFIIQEDGFYILQEDGFRILLE